jgi:hypothetical protein
VISGSASSSPPGRLPPCAAWTWAMCFWLPPFRERQGTGDLPVKAWPPPAEHWTGSLMR